MKLVAKKDFANVPSLAIKLEWYVKGADGKPLKNHIYKGARFSIGTSEIFDELDETDKNKVAQLMASNSVMVASDKPAVDKIDAEVAADRQREKQEKRRIKHEENRLTFDRRIGIWAIVVGLLAIAVTLYFELHK